MGGHGGLNILPQKRWNVYNYENREKVRRDEEQAAREEQLKREQTRKRDSEIRLERLRTARGLAPSIPPQPNPSSSDHSEPNNSSSDPGHINLFEGIKIFDPIREPPQKEASSGKKRKEEGKPKPKPKPVIVVGPEDEKYRLGYGLAGKGVQLPWYVRKKSNDDVGNDKDERVEADRRESNGQKKRKTMEELREERLKREKKEKDRERALKREKEPSRRDVYYGSRNRFTR